MYSDVFGSNLHLLFRCVKCPLKGKKGSLFLTGTNRSFPEPQPAMTTIAASEEGTLKRHLKAIPFHACFPHLGASICLFCLCIWCVSCLKFPCLCFVKCFFMYQLAFWPWLTLINSLYILSSVSLLELATINGSRYRSVIQTKGLCVLYA